MLVPQLSALRASERFVREQAGPRSVVIFGSTGSIGRSTLEVVRGYPDKFKIKALIGNKNIDLLAAQANEFLPDLVACDASKISELRSLLGGKFQVVTVTESEQWLAAQPSNTTVVAAWVGVAGLRSVLAALSAGQTVALANKESLVAGGALVREAIERDRGILLPVDSEHSAIYQVLHGERFEDIKRILLTASGGPFLNTPLADLASVSPAQALKHPRWSMGAKVSIDSATMVNKGLELIEAHWLFGVPAQNIDVVVHPESIIHSLIELRDGVQLAQASVPDMRGPIAYALNFPKGRLEGLLPELSLPALQTLSFKELDPARFPAVALAREALIQGGAASAVFNMANEVAVQSFLEGRLAFNHIVPKVAKMLEKFASINVQTLGDLEHLNLDVRGACA